MANYVKPLFDYPLCPKCFRLPFLQISENNPENVIINCSCSFSQVFTIKDFLFLADKNKHKVPMCEKFAEHQKNEGKYFCVQCQMIICKECGLNHKKWAFDHILLSLELNLNSNCNLHKNQKFEFFCNKCKLHLCRLCVSQHQHQEHILFLPDIIDSKIYQSICKSISSSENFVYNYLTKIKNDIISNLKKEILRIEKAFELNQKKNDYILQLIKIMNDSFINYSPNYYLYTNLLNNCHLKFQNLNKNFNCADTSNNNINKIVDYFNYSLIKVSSNISNLNLNLVKELKIHTSQIAHLCLLHDERLASCSTDKTINIFNLHKGYRQLTIESQSLLKNYYGHSNTISYISQLRTNQIVSSSFDNTIKIWEFDDEDNYICKANLEGHKDGVLKVIVLSKNRLASCSLDTTIKIWSAVYPYVCIRTLVGHTEKVNSIIEICNKSYLVSGNSGQDSSIRFWNLNSYKCEHVINDVNCSYKNSLFEIDDNKILSGFIEGVYIINANEYIMEKIVKYDNLGCVMCFTRLQKGVVVCGCQYGDIIMFDLVTNKFIGNKIKLHDSDIVSIINVKNCFLISGSFDTTIKLWRY